MKESLFESNSNKEIPPVKESTELGSGSITDSRKIDNDNDASNSPVSPSESAKKEIKHDSNSENIDEHAPVMDNTKKKRRKSKVRSRQKNIRKDNRKAHQKPDYLKLGRPNYSGLPLTAETRRHLKLPEKLTQNRFEKHFVLTAKKCASKPDATLGTFLDVLNSVESTRFGQPNETSGVPNFSGDNVREEKISKKKKKSTYRNLQ